jgi:hypothetical protein
MVRRRDGRKFICVACGDVRGRSGKHLYHPCLSRHCKNQTFSLECRLITSLRPVRAEFNCEDTFHIPSFTHHLSRSLLSVDSIVIMSDCEYAVLLERVVLPILKEHAVACRAASSPLCGVCGSATTQIIQTPISIVQDIDHPFLSVWVHSLCDKAECEERTKNDMDSIMGRLKRQLSDEMHSEAKACKVCGKSVGMKRCARCKTVAYCGTEHQRVDWKIHKKFCVPVDREGD